MMRRENRSVWPFVLLMVYFVIADCIANWDATLSIRCLQAGGSFRKERPESFFRGRDLCYPKANQ